MKNPFRRRHDEVENARANRRRIEGAVLRRAEARLERLYRDERALRVQWAGLLDERESRHARGVLRRFRECRLERTALEALMSKPVRPVGCFVLSSWLLRDSFRVCTATPEEGMHFVVGIEVDGVAVGTSIVEFTYAERTIVRAAGVHRETAAITAESAETGHRILGIVHSHPGYGPEANHPSGTDLATHRLWEHTAPFFGGIWSRSGHLRIFTAGRPAAVSVVGTHLEQIDEHNWKLRDEFVGGAA